MTIKRKHPIISEYFPNHDFAILLPSLIPMSTDKSEKRPTEMADRTGETPLAPAPKPLAIQLIDNAKPNEMDSIHEMM